ncbi:MAG: hypothetical protein IJS28_02525 [Synergistaceae bacterium]|nr:hypothetical protein [Synergistaceae bacterium]
MLLIILWLIQDLLTVFTGGGMQIPGVFMLGLVYRLLVDDGTESEDSLWAIWSAFAAGILWDLRWVGIPGFFTLGYVIVVMIVIQVWGAIPPSSRGASGTSLIVFALMEVSQMLPPLLPVLILGGSAGWNFFLMQQIYSLPAILFCMYIYLHHVRNNKV